MASPRTRIRAVPALAALLPPRLLGVSGGGDGPPALSADASKGQQVAKDRGCANCHTPDGRRSEGPTWKGLYGSTVTLADGSTVVADDAYLARSIREPKAQMVQGYKSPMPTTPGVTDAEI